MSEQDRIEHDLLVEMELAADALYGIQTARALVKFPITDVPISHFPELVVALAMVKKASARSNRDLGTLGNETCDAIIGVCDEIIAGQHHRYFVVDMIQGGAGTSTNMNANEVIANVALKNLGAAAGDYRRLHPTETRLRNAPV